MFKSKQIEQLKQENKDLRNELEEQKDTSRYFINELENILSHAERCKTPAVIVVDKIKEVVCQQNITTSNKLM